MADEVGELVGFLVDPREQIQKIALDNVVGLTGSEDGISALARTNAIPLLLKLLPESSDQEKTAKILAALVNLFASEQCTAAVREREGKICGCVMGVLSESAKAARGPLSQHDANKTWTIIELCAMLLTNLTQTESAVDALLQKGESVEGFYVCQLLDILIQETNKGDNPRKAKGQGHPIAHVASVIMNVSQGEIGQHLILDKKRNIMGHLCKLSSHPDDTIRRGVLGAIKNCFYGKQSDILYFATNDPKYNPDGIPSGPRLGVELGKLLVASEKKFSESDKEGMAEEWVALNAGGGKAEVDVSTIALILETYLLLCISRPVREYFRAIQLYILLRDLDLRVDDERVTELVCEL
eukprot:CAMPEP_0119126914 /NCGR_PEP_ID=MMETSP1310-20130426/5652_1 /TAXON_ID=464262 /ORGANISM="Genus nov. species nov., Strain RCC2339" /LENGTH=353 /DNA_ID=CAMNT_0007117111 /DNA_START=80 /DNA_END=1138 /DNA_ORIENTATION=-